MLFALGHEVVRFFQTRTFFAIWPRIPNAGMKLHQVTLCGPKYGRKFPENRRKLPEHGQKYPELDLYIFNWNSRMENHEFGRFSSNKHPFTHFVPFSFAK